MHRVALVLLLTATAHAGQPTLELTPLSSHELGDAWHCRVQNAAGETVFAEDPTTPRTFVRVDGKLFAVKQTLNLGPPGHPKVGDELVRSYSDGHVTVRFAFTVTAALSQEAAERFPRGDTVRAKGTAIVTMGKNHQREHNGLTMTCR